MDNKIEDPLLIELLNKEALPHLQNLYKGLRKPEKYEFPYTKDWVKGSNHYTGSVYIKPIYSTQSANWQRVVIRKGGVSSD